MYRNYIKPFLGFICAIIGLPIFAIIFIIIAPLIFIEDKGPIFYNAPRLGRNGKVFKMYKFRSMKVNAPDLRNADGSTYNAEDDPRVTKIGHFLRKTSLDETAQLLNVLIGDMAIIGPRPSLPGVEMTKERMKRLSVRPGITGYSQAYYRNSDNLIQRAKNDIYYVENVSFLLDLKILFKTIETVLRRSNVYRNKEKTHENS